MKIVSNGVVVNATFKHSCGHEGPTLAYGGKEFAEGDRSKQEGQDCIFCTNDKRLEEARQRRELQN